MNLGFSHTDYNEKNEARGHVDLDYDPNLFVQNAKNPTDYPEERPEGEE